MGSEGLIPGFSVGVCVHRLLQPSSPTLRRGWVGMPGKQPSRFEAGFILLGCDAQRYRLVLIFALGSIWLWLLWQCS